VKRIIFRYWLFNILISIVLFIIYRITITATNQADRSFLDSFLQLLDAILNVAYSFIYLIGIAFCSLTIFLNQIDRIRTHFYLSLLTFLGIPIFCVSYIIIHGLIDSSIYHITAVLNLLVFSIIYLLLTTLQFLSFRKGIKKLQASNTPE